MGSLILRVMMHFWNIINIYQRPVVYQQTVTNNRYMSHKRELDNVTHVFDVKQLKISRTPRKPFRAKAVYSYEVSRYTFREGEFIDKHTVRMPELCLFLFRNTKIPHVLAINAFLNIEQNDAGGLDEAKN